MTRSTSRLRGAIAPSLTWQFATTALLSLGIMVAPAHAEVYILDFEKNAQGESLSSGTQIDHEWADWGLNITGKNYKTGDNNAPLLLYDTSQSGADNDLRTGANWGTPNQGNALIIQEYNNDSYNLNTPDDEASGGHIWFNFDQEVGFNQFSLLDIDDNFGSRSGTQVRVLGKDADNNTVLNINIDNLIKRFAAEYDDPDHAKSQGQSLTHAYKNGLDEYIDVTITQVGNKRDNNSMFQFDFDETELERVQFRYSGVSGAISGLQWNDLQPEAPPQLPEPSVSIGLLIMGFAGSYKLIKGHTQAS